MTDGVTSPRGGGYGGVAWVLCCTCCSRPCRACGLDLFCDGVCLFCADHDIFSRAVRASQKSIVLLVRACGWKDIAVLNILTCANWLSYFTAIKYYIEPAMEAAKGSGL